MNKFRKLFMKQYNWVFADEISSNYKCMRGIFLALIHSFIFGIIYIIINTLI